MTILTEIEQFLTASGMTAHRFGVLAGNDSGMVPRLRAGREPSKATRAKIEAFLATERANPSPRVTKGPIAGSHVCGCGASMTRKATQCRRCAGESIAGRQRRPMPDDFPEVAPGKSVNMLMAIYSCGPGPVARWRKQAGILPSRPAANVKLPRREARAVPDGFALVARGMTMKQLRERFGASEALVRRWCAEAGVEPRRAGYAYFRQVQPRALPDARDNSRAGLAAQYLQKFGSVVRCDAEGRVDPRGTHWLRGGRYVLTDDEIMSRATRLGWAPDAWREVIAA